MYFGTEVNQRTNQAEGVFHLSLEEMKRFKDVQDHAENRENR
jgi:hypothetical protein